MDRQSLIGLSLIAVIFVAWFYISSLYTEPPKPVSQALSDSTSVVGNADSVNASSVSHIKSAAIIASDSIFVKSVSTASFTIKTPKYLAKMESKGAAISSFEIFDYKTDDKPVQLIVDPAVSSLNYSFELNDGRVINTSDLHFDFLNSGSAAELTRSEDSVLVKLSAKTTTGQEVLLSFTFHGEGYVIHHSAKLLGFDQSMPQQRIELQWNNGIRYSEKNVTDENASAEAFLYFNDDSDYLNATSTTEDEELAYQGNHIGWSSIRSKYFAVAFINSDGKTNGARVWGRTDIDVNNISKENYHMVQYVPFGNEREWTKKTDIMLTPLEYDYLKSFDNGIQYMMSLGIPYIVKPISEYFVLPVFEFLYGYIYNWGLVIIVFTILIRIITAPLTESSFKGMAKMREFGPKMQDIQAKFKDDKEKLQTEMLKFYRENGYNPLGGCLPMLLQMPILFALYVVFAHAIQLRQSEFLWAHDLSLPDSILSLPFSIPLYGDHVSLWALLMAGSMILQMKSTPQTNKEQALIMMWVFPIMMLLMFNSLSSGLNMYYFLSNVLQFGQQWWYNKRNPTSTLLLNTAQK